jgi:pyruvate dehydrogenase E2 component (dihydrolipoamide acetyltransferase)
MPKWGLTMKEGKVSKWFKSEGDTVQKDEPLFEVETSKITNTVPSPADGILFQVVIPAGETVPVQTIVALIAAPGETPERLTPATASAPAAKVDAPQAETQPAEDKSFVSASPIARRLAKEWGIPLSQVRGTGPDGRVTEDDVKNFKATHDAQATPGRTPAAASAGIAVDPRIASFAEQAGVDLSRITGTGPGGKITKADVLRAMNPNLSSKAQQSAAPQPAHAPSATAGTILPMAGMRKIIADNMMASIHQSAQLSVFVEIDATRLLSLHQKIKDKYGKDEQVRLSINDIVALAVCRSLKDHPMMNSWLTDEGIVLHAEVNLGIAVALPEGLVVPNVKDAGNKGLLELSADIRRVVELARQGKLTFDEIQGGTFTITNVSRLGVDGFTPILNPPETGILGVGRIVQKPGIDETGQIAIRSFMTLSLTFDHRVVDGAPAMRFLRTLADYLEEPVMLLA